MTKKIVMLLWHTSKLELYKKKKEKKKRKKCTIEFA